MGTEVYANGNEIACKKGGGKVIASFPDVCMSPPSPPAGPLPIPYPNTSFSKDLKEGSKTVKIKGGPAALMGQSFYKTSPLGNEAATRSFGANVLSHQITGKTYFGASSMDISFEGKKVCRHIDITSSNHGSHPAGVAVPNPNLEAMFIASYQKETGICECCGDPVHSAGRPMTMAGWYGMNKVDSSGKLTPDALGKRARYRQLVREKDARGCSCRVLPEEPCNVHYETTQLERDEIIAKYDALKACRGYREAFLGVPSMAIVNPIANAARAAAIAAGDPTGNTAHAQAVQEQRKVNHLTPKSAGGCPIGDGNLAAQQSLCAGCKDIEDQFTVWQSARTMKP